MGQELVEPLITNPCIAKALPGYLRESENLKLNNDFDMTPRVREGARFRFY